MRNADASLPDLDELLFPADYERDELDRARLRDASQRHTAIVHLLRGIDRADADPVDAVHRGGAELGGGQLSRARRGRVLPGCLRVGRRANCCACGSARDRDGREQHRLSVEVDAVPSRALRPCRAPGCPRLRAEGACTEHRGELARERGNSAAREPMCRIRLAPRLTVAGHEWGGRVESLGASPRDGGHPTTRMAAKLNVCV